MTSDSPSVVPSLFCNKLSETRIRHGQWKMGAQGEGAKGRGLLLSQMSAYPFFILLPSGLKHFSQRKEGGVKGSILERALYVTGHHVLSDSEILEAIKILILTPQG